MLWTSFIWFLLTLEAEATEIRDMWWQTRPVLWTGVVFHTLKHPRTSSLNAVTPTASGCIPFIILSLNKTSKQRCSSWELEPWTDPHARYSFKHDIIIKRGWMEHRVCTDMCTCAIDVISVKYKWMLWIDQREEKHPELSFERGIYRLGTTTDEGTNVKVGLRRPCRGQRCSSREVDETKHTNKGATRLRNLRPRETDPWWEGKLACPRRHSHLLPLSPSYNGL